MPFRLRTHCSFDRRTRCRFPDPLGAQTGWPQGCRCAGVARRDLDAGASGARRWPGKGPQGRDENLAAVAGFGAAAREMAAGLVERTAHVSALRDRAEQAMLSLAPDTVIYGRVKRALAIRASSICRGSRLKPGRSPSISKVWRCRRCRLLLGKGGCKPRADRHGRGCRNRGASAVDRPGNDAKRYRSLRRGLRKDCSPPQTGGQAA